MRCFVYCWIVAGRIDVVWHDEMMRREECAVEHVATDFDSDGTVIE